MTTKFNWWALGIGLEAALLALVPTMLLLPLLPIVATSVVLGVYTLFGAGDEDPRSVAILVLTAVAATWSLIQYWILAVATAKGCQYRFGFSFWLAAIGSTALMVTFREGGLFGLPTAIGAVHFTAIQLLWRRREAMAQADSS
ncbi:MAG: hypothetical protein ABS43_20565 [Bordetella sp. SCN 67-23]|nr:hypothetical protein [Burkholderiales bacterium]ODS71504.1 MAG: hypothetical protein ABS43_20565 [Bordetella sp. SCN 67-23]OJW87524.1 MAG: hypothetical protein BGO71_29570 [Burkholderiales bacterium 67-32]